MLPLCRYILLAGLIAVAYSAGAQDRCGIVEVTQKLRGKRSLLESDDQFELWLKEKRARAAGRINAAGVYRIPVVVHVIHKGEAVGSGVNISEAQILSQISVLNKDFNRLNTDASNTPAAFQPVAGSIAIEFVLAKQSPEGTATNGILRTRGSRNQWSINDDATLKAQSYWAAEDYLNIWVTDLSSTLLGYAQFPVSDLDGLEDAEDNRLTDGVVIDYTVFGSSDDGSFSLQSSYNKGRTATHEVGHFLGLRHIWGDDNGACNGSGDYVSDTPDQGNSTNGCPSHPQTSCSVTKMFQNYMDYTNDACMNLFTQGQVGRMVTVLENSPRRASLMDSRGLEDVVTYARDLAIDAILSPGADECNGMATPVIRLKNNGSETITSARIQLKLNDSVQETKEVTYSPGIATFSTGQVTFSPVMLLSGTHQLEFTILLVNGSADENPANDALPVTTEVPYGISVPFAERFTAMPSDWTVRNPNAGTIAWSVTTAPDDSTSNTAAYLNFYNNTSTDGQTDLLITPVFDLTSAAFPYLTFDVAYAPYRAYSDGLKVYVLNGCNMDISQGTEVYSKTGSALATVSARAAFVPANEGEWRKEIINLSAFAGQSHIQLAFAAVSDGGNNLYLDNISVVRTISENVAITKIISPSPVQCGSTAQPVITIKNMGEVTVSSLTVNYSLNNGAEESQEVTDLDLRPGAEMQISLPEISLSEGSNMLDFGLASPNGYEDVDPSNNEKRFTTMVSTIADLIPFRENFDTGTEDRWTMINPGGGYSWELVTTNYGQSAYFAAEEDTTTGDEAWLASPVLDLSAITAASVFFDLSYKYQLEGGKMNTTEDNLRILASTDCGQTYDQVLFDEHGQTLSVTTRSSGPVPQTPEDWTKRYVNLSTLAGQDQVRLAFVFTNGNGSDIHLDNIEFFTSDDTSPLSIQEPFAIYGTDGESPRDFYVTFNLDKRQPVLYDLVDTMGKTLVKQQLTDVLNQTYVIDAGQASTGIYVFRLQIGSKFYSHKVYVGR